MFLFKGLKVCSASPQNRVLSQFLAGVFNFVNNQICAPTLDTTKQKIQVLLLAIFKKKYCFEDNVKDNKLVPYKKNSTTSEFVPLACVDMRFGQWLCSVVFDFDRLFGSVATRNLVCGHLVSWYFLEGLTGIVFNPLSNFFCYNGHSLSPSTSESAITFFGLKLFENSVGICVTNREDIDGATWGLLTWIQAFKLVSILAMVDKDTYTILALCADSVFFGVYEKKLILIIECVSFLQLLWSNTLNNENIRLFVLYKENEFFITFQCGDFRIILSYNLADQSWSISFFVMAVLDMNQHLSQNFIGGKHA